MELRVSGAQIPVGREVTENSETKSRAIDFAVAEKADVLLTPEGSLSGYRADFDQEAVSEALEGLVAKASEHQLALALGTCFVEPEDGRCYNQLRFYDRDGACLGFHSKILRCGTLDDSPEGEINDSRPLPSARSN